MSTVEMVVPAAEPRGLSIHGGSGMLAMAMMPEEEFSQRLAALKRGQERIKLIKRELMTEGIHYGTIPGTDKPTLYKSGAEVLCDAYNLRPDFAPRIEYGDGEGAPVIRVTMRCEMHRSDLNGPVVAVGYGAANSWERKHRYRRGERACPECGTIGSVIKGKADFGGGWLCWAKKGGCGAKWKDGAQEIESQAVSDIENPDQHDLENTLVKMAKKRAFLDATLTGTASSDLFTQDLDEQEHHEEKPKAPPKRQASPPPEREPGEDPEYPHDHEAHERHGVEPAKSAPPKPSGPSAACPECGKSAGPSKYPKPGKTHYCNGCKLPFEPEARG